MWIYRRTSMLMTVWVLLVSTAQPATLEQVLERMRSGNPAFETAQAAVEVSKGYHRQAGLRSNPSLSVENEEMSLSRFGSLGRASTTLALSQPFDSWNKRSLNQLTTAKDVALARLETRALELELSSLVCQTFSLILVSEEREHLLKKFLEQSQRVLETVTEQVLGGERPIMEQLRVQAELHNIEVRQQQDEAEQQRLILQLAALVGETSPTFLPLEGSLDFFLAPFDSEELIGLLDLHPRLQSESLQLDKSLLEQQIAARDWLPDPEITLGIESNRIEDDTSLVFGITVPLPIFNRNQGLFQAAGASVDLARASGEKTRFDLTSEIHSLTTQANALREALLTHEQMTLPQLRRVNELVFEGYRMGEFGYLEVVESQSAQIEAEIQRQEIMEDLLEVQAQLVSLDLFLKNREKQND